MVFPSSRFSITYAALKPGQNPAALTAPQRRGLRWVDGTMSISPFKVVLAPAPVGSFRGKNPMFSNSKSSSKIGGGDSKSAATGNQSQPPRGSSGASAGNQCGAVVSSVPERSATRTKVHPLFFWTLATFHSLKETRWVLEQIRGGKLNGHNRSCCHTDALYEAKANDTIDTSNDTNVGAGNDNQDQEGHDMSWDDLVATSDPQEVEFSQAAIGESDSATLVVKKHIVRVETALELGWKDLTSAAGLRDSAADRQTMSSMKGDGTNGDGTNGDVAMKGSSSSITATASRLTRKPKKAALVNPMLPSPSSAPMTAITSFVSNKENLPPMMSTPSPGPTAFGAPQQQLQHHHQHHHHHHQQQLPLQHLDQRHYMQHHHHHPHMHQHHTHHHNHAPAPFERPPPVVAWSGRVNAQGTVVRPPVPSAEQKPHELYPQDDVHPPPPRRGPMMEPQHSTAHGSAVNLHTAQEQRHPQLQHQQQHQQHQQTQQQHHQQQHQQHQQAHQQQHQQQQHQQAQQLQQDQPHPDQQQQRQRHEQEEDRELSVQAEEEDAGDNVDVEPCHRITTPRPTGAVLMEMKALLGMGTGCPG